MLLEIFLLSDREVDKRRIRTVMWHPVWGQLLSPLIQKLSRGWFIHWEVLPVSLSQRAPRKAAESSRRPRKQKRLWKRVHEESLAVHRNTCVLPGLPPLCANTLSAQALSTSASHIFCPQASLHTCSTALLLAASQLNEQNHCKMSQKLLWKNTALLCAHKTVLMLVWSLKCGLLSYSPQIYLTQGHTLLG